MSSIVQSFQKRNHGAAALPVSQTHDSKDRGAAALRRRISSLSFKIQPISSPATQWAFQRSKSVSAMGEYAGSSIRKWWDWGWSWILSKKPPFAQDLEMNEEETRVLGCHNKGSWRHVFYKVRYEVRKLVRSDDKVGLPQTYRLMLSISSLLAAAQSPPSISSLALLHMTSMKQEWRSTYGPPSSVVSDESNIDCL
ncbi:hypothetical protein POTOM_016294 [Populus tomentosa]|uniref:Uncharacterized protein n=1 Tax=Populus tomentosa TaxID=118781 RepID=A0A8X8A4H8_POPTO|nr:hypothetical protein POTOM_016294 [Populus tomentosa]